LNTWENLENSCKRVTGKPFWVGGGRLGEEGKKKAVFKNSGSGSGDRRGFLFTDIQGGEKKPIQKGAELAELAKNLCIRRGARRVV